MKRTDKIKMLREIMNGDRSLAELGDKVFKIAIDSDRTTYHINEQEVGEDVFEHEFNLALKSQRRMATSVNIID